jgi:putative FmdB family regulatory protein
MPLYEYKCKKCQKRFEVIRRVTDSDPVECPECGEPASRLLSGFAIGGSTGSFSSGSTGGGCSWSGG